MEGVRLDPKLFKEVLLSWTDFLPCIVFLMFDFSLQLGKVHTTKYGLMRIFKERALVLGKLLVADT